MYLCKDCVNSSDYFPYNGKVVTNPNDVKLKHLLLLDHCFYFFYQHHIPIQPIKHVLENNVYKQTIICRLCLDSIEPEYYGKYYCYRCETTINICYHRLITSFMHVSEIDIIDDVRYCIKNIIVQFV